MTARSLVLLCLALPACGLPDYDFGASSSAGGSSGDASAGTGGIDGGSGGAAGNGGIAGGGSGGVAGGGGAPPACNGDPDCAATPNTPKCNPATGSCAPCLPSDDVCGAGLYCGPSGSTFQCKVGCKVGSSDCPSPLQCDAVQHLCLGCAQDDDCPAGQICDTGSTACVPGCTPSHACETNFSCCSGSCSALGIDPDNCGSCGNVCPTPANGKRVCIQAKCGVECTIPFSQNCNGNIADGCEVDVKTDSQHCGACGSPCSGTQSCIDGKCT